MKRTFVAIKFTPTKHLEHVINGLHQALLTAKIRWVNVANLHLTLHFFGETPDEKLPLVRDILQQLASQTASFSFVAEGISWFGSRGCSGVVYLGTRESAQLKALVDSLRGLLSDAGFTFEKRPFTAHLTLGRVHWLKDVDRFYRILERAGHSACQELLVDELAFYESVLKPSGPEYKILSVFRLQ